MIDVTFRKDKMLDRVDEILPLVPRTKQKRKSDEEWGNVFNELMDIMRPLFCVFQSNRSYVYFIKTEDSSAMKIGYSISPQQRLAELQTANHQELVLVGTICGRQELEGALHELFSRHCLRNEWFDASVCRLFEAAFTKLGEQIKRNKEKANGESKPTEGE